MSDERPQDDAATPGQARTLADHEPGTLPWLVAIIQTLLGPDGCPWDRKQTLQSVKHYLLEEAYEVCEAIEEQDRAHLGEELGDVLYILVFQAALGGVQMEHIVRGAGEKLIRRHPHVFGDVEVDGADQVLANWERIKQQERGGERRSVLAGVPTAMPALQRAHRLTERAAKVGFDWPDAAGAREKVDEELAEADQAVLAGDREAAADEVGDLLFAVVNWARKLGVEPEDALRRTTGRFMDRFRYIEDILEGRGEKMEEAGLEELDRLWEEAKGREG